MSSPPEGPEHRTDTLSPVSPKPVHFPAPSNIALLENQMDPAFDGTEVSLQKQAATTEGTKNNSDLAIINSQPLKMEDSSNQGSQSTLAPLDPVALPNNQMNGTSVAHDNAIQSFAQPEGTANPSLASPLGESEASVQAESFPSLATQAVSTAPSTVSASASPAGQPSGDGGQIDSSQTVPQPSNAAPLPSLPTNIDIQALLDNLSASSNASTAPTADTLTATTSQPADPGASETLLHPDQSTATPLHGALPHVTPNAANLPPRPPSQTAPSEQTIQEQIGSDGQAKAAVLEKPSSSSVDPSFAPLAHAAPPPLPTAGAPGVLNAGVSSLPPPPLPSFQTPQNNASSASATSIQNAISPSFNKQGLVVSRPGEEVHGVTEGENIPWGTDTQRKYDAFLAEERRYVLEGNWDRFPIGSRLFLGNLPSEKVTKRDLFHVFHRHGKLAQISIKQAYGFVQYLDAGCCARAMAIEQGVSIRGKAIHLEISVPGGKKRHQQNEGRSSRNRRSRSPPASRNSGRNSRSDNYHRTRSPNRARNDHYDTRTPRSPQQPHNNAMVPGTGADAQLPLPYRQPGQVPDVQVIAKEPLEKQFVQYIEGAFTRRGLRADVLFLGAGLEESLVMRRQIVEGVLAVMKVDRVSQAVQRFQLTVFNRGAGNSNVNFDDYQNLEMHIVVELVLRAKQNSRPQQSAAQYGYQSVPAPAQQPLPYPPVNQQPISPTFPQQTPPQHPSSQVPPPSSIPNMDNQALQDLLKTLSKQPSSASTPQQGQPPQFNQYTQQPPTQGAAPDLSQILRAVQSSSGVQSQGQQPFGQPQAQIPPQEPPRQQPGGALDISQIMAQLHRYER